MKNYALNITLTLMASAYAVSAWGEAPAGYYSSCEGKYGASLLNELCNKVSSHTNVGYDGLWEVYKTSDVRSDGTVWDMYSTKRWSVGKEHCGNYKVVGDCINREHSFPKSWFDDASPMYSDAYHLYPTDGKVNGQRSNFPYGECANGTTLPANGNIKALGKLGTSTFPGYSGKVFEPDDEYKGDFARSYFYMAAAYNNKIAGWNSDMLAGNSYPAYKDWAINLLLKWHRQDPVSQKEIDRNEAVAGYQKNRNPFIDYPEMAEHIWGDKKNVGWREHEEVEPVFTSPTAGSTIDMGVTSVGRTLTYTINVKGAALEEDISVSIAGSGFAANTTRLDKTNVCDINGADLIISYTSAEAIYASAVVTLTSGKAILQFNLKAQAMDGIPVGTPQNVSDRSFTATWINIDDPTTQYTFTLWQDSEIVSGYPIQVSASAQRYDVQDLEASTTYEYQLSNGTVVSQKMQVTTGEAIPSIQFLYDGDLYFTAQPGQPSDAAEVLIDVENITRDITITVTSPFQLSTDKQNWDNEITLSPEEDRFYMRMYAQTAGEYTTTLRATAGDYTNDVWVEGKAGATISFIEDFEQDAAGLGNYSGGEFQGTACRWNLTNAGIYAGNSEPYHSENQSIRFGKASSGISSIEMLEDRTHGVGTVSFWVRKWNKDEASEVVVEASTDGGITWHISGTHTFSKENEWEQATVAVNEEGRVRIRLSRDTNGGRLNLDDVEMTDWSTVNIVNSTIDYHRWDAFCRAGQLVIESEDADSRFTVYSMDGILHYAGSADGTVALSLPAGLYVVYSRDFSRRVLIK